MTTTKTQNHKTTHQLQMTNPNGNAIIEICPKSPNQSLAIPPEAIQSKLVVSLTKPFKTPHQPNGKHS